MSLPTRDDIQARVRALLALISNTDKGLVKELTDSLLTKSEVVFTVSEKLYVLVLRHGDVTMTTKEQHESSKRTGYWGD